VKLKGAGGTFPLSQICADIAKSTRAKPAQRLDPKTINRMISFLTLNLYENRR
jgi:hypothetical protein